jgi:hypothetical protein
MQQITYALQFKGQATPGSSPDTMSAQSSAGSCRITANLGQQGLSASIEQVAGGAASFESTVTLTGANSFQESGSIGFGAGNLLHFSTVGQGYLGASADPDLKHGTVTWKIDRGEGQFEGASGLITSNFTVSGSGEVVDNHLGIVFVR